MVQPDAVLELGGGAHSPWMARDKREVLAEILAQDLRLKVRCIQRDDPYMTHDLPCQPASKHHHITTASAIAYTLLPPDWTRRVSYSSDAMVT